MRGFTLIEALVAVAILGLLAGFMLVNYRSGSQGLAEQRSLKIIAQAVRTAQVKALGSEKNCSSGAISCKYYGAHFEVGSAEIKVFGSDDGVYSAGIDTDIEAITLEEGVLVSSLSASYACQASTCFDVSFSPPDPTVSFSPDPGTSSVAIFITGGRSASVGKGGSVDIN